jgi:hypothetical protein
MTKLETSITQLSGLMFAARLLGNLEIYDACKSAVEAMAEAQVELNQLKEEKENAKSVH